MKSFFPKPVNIKSRIISILILLLTVILLFITNKASTTLQNGSFSIIDDDVPLANLVNAYFFITSDISLEDLTSINEENFEFVGEGTVFFQNEIYNDAPAVINAIYSSPDISPFLNNNQHVEWCYLIKYDSYYLVGGVIKDVTEATDATIENDHSLETEAEYYLYNPSLYDATLTSVTPDLTEYVGSGLYRYTKDLFNSPDEVWSQVCSEPEYESPSGEYIEWGTAYRYHGKTVVIGKYVEGERPSLNSQQLLADEDYLEDKSDESFLSQSERDDSLVFSEFTPDSSAVKTYSFDNISSLKKADLYDNDHVITEGYLSPGDNGNAAYTITSSPDYPTDNIFVIPLDNGKFAQMDFESSDTLNVACGGIQPNTDISEQLNNIISASVNKITSIQFNSGTYIIDNTIFLDSLKYIGTGDTVLSVSPSFAGKGDKVMLTSPSSNKQFTLFFDNIDFLLEATPEHTKNNQEIVFLALHNIDSCSIKNCNIKSVPVDGGFIKTDLLWFRFSETHKNITIENCTFENFTGWSHPVNSTDFLPGGCLWFAGKDAGSVIENVNVINCNFETTVSDEVFSCWRGNFRNIRVSGCNIKCSHRKNDNVMAFFEGSFKNIKISNTDITLDSASDCAIKLFSTTDTSDITYENCNININSTDSANQHDLFLCSSDNYGSTYRFTNCNIVGVDGSKYDSVVYVRKSSDSNVIFENCDIDGRFSYGLLFFETTNNASLLCTSSRINTHTVLMNLKKADNTNLYIDNNTFNSKITTTVNASGSFDYTFTNNTITADSPGTLVNLNNITTVNSASKLTVKSNISQKTFKNFYSNSNITENSFMTVNQ